MESFKVYLLLNLINGKRYVGVSKDPSERLRKGHRYAKSAIGKAIRKYGLQNFLLSVIAEGSEDFCYSIEDDLIEAHSARYSQHGYNILRGGRKPGGQSGVKRTQETREKMRATQLARGAAHSDEVKKKISDAKKGKKLSPEHRASISRAHFGAKRSEKARENMSIAQRGRIVSDETRAKLSAALRGKKRKPLSGEARRKISESNKKSRAKK